MSGSASPKAETDHAELSALLRTLPLGVQASELHGSLSGFLCAGGRAGPDDWIGQLELAADGSVASHPCLRALRDACSAQFAGAQARIDPLLPPASAPLARRTDALVDWCRGFLGGFGLVGATLRTPLSADACEILSDFATIAASRFDCDEAEDAQAFNDVLEFVRTASAWLHREIREGARGAPRSLH